MKNLKEVFKYVKLAPFTEDFTSINVKAGLYHRINGKSTAAGKEKDLTEDDKTQLKAGLTALMKDIKKVIDEA